MGSDDTFRACDADRERAVEVIRDAYIHGRLDLAEFHERTEAAFAGRTWGDLRKLTSDLPPAATTGPQLPRAGGGGRADPPASCSPLPVLPIAVLWLAASLTMHSPVALIPIMFFLILAVRAAVRLRGAPRDGQGPPHRGGVSRRPGGPH